MNLAAQDDLELLAWHRYPFLLVRPLSRTAEGVYVSARRLAASFAADTHSTIYSLPKAPYKKGQDHPTSYTDCEVEIC